MKNRRVRLLVVFLLFVSFSKAQESFEIYPNLKSQKEFKLCAAFTSTSFEKGNPEKFLQTLESAIDKYGIDMVNAYHFNSEKWVSHKAYDKLEDSRDTEYIKRYRSIYKRLKDKGVYLIIGAGEQTVTEGLFEQYPEMKTIENGLFWKFIEQKAGELYEVIPEMDCYEIYLWETTWVSDMKVFPDLLFNSYLEFPYLSHSDYLTQMLDAYSRAAQSHNKDFMLLAFSHFPYQEQLIIEALKNRDRNYPLLMDHKCQSGDWHPFKPANNIMNTITDLPAQLQFDGTGEYLGQSLMPYCFPGEIQARLQHALAVNHNINTLSMRVNWMNGSLFGKPNEINFYTLYRLAEDPFTPVEEIWKDWAVERFGEKAAEKVISALKRTNDIGNRIFYLEGMWLFNHSALASLPYLESHAVNYAKATALLKPWDIMGNYRMNELLNYPREYLIKQEVVADRDEAIRLNALSLKDIEAARKDLAPADYTMLKEQLTRQRDMARASKLQMEAFFRYRIEKLGAPEKGPENRRKLEACLQEMEQLGQEMKKTYKDEFPFLESRLFEAFIEQVREATKNTV